VLDNVANKAVQKYQGMSCEQLWAQKAQPKAAGLPIEHYSFEAVETLKDKDRAEFDYLNSQPTTFVLPAEAVDRLRSAEGEIIAASPEFQRLLKDSGVKFVEAAAEGAGARAGSTPPKAAGVTC
jgi:NTE family protein